MNFTEQQMRDPWAFCLETIADRGWTSKQVAEKTGAPWSTTRGLLNGTNMYPRYELLQSILKICIEQEVEVEHDFL